MELYQYIIIITFLLIVALALVKGNKKDFNIELNNVDLIDVIFDSCDLSNKGFNERLISRVEFINCKLVGTTFIDSSIRDVLFNKCQAKYNNISDSNIEGIIFDNYSLKGIIIEPFQSASIVDMLGVNFKDLKS